MSRSSRLIGLLSALLICPSTGLAEETGPKPEDPCTYRAFAWHVKKKKAVDRFKVSKTRAELTDEERDPDDPRCTVCSEDQIPVKVEGLPEVKVCKYYAPQIEAALKQAASEGFKVRTLVGYRPGRTRGKVVNDRRSQFSNHSYGTAIDINARQNGLHARCNLDTPPKSAADIKRCSLRVGGAWDPEKRPTQTIVEGGPVHKAFTAFWKWGGAIKGPIRDFMHFSITGY